MILTFLPGGTLAEWPPFALKSCELSASLFQINFPLTQIARHDPLSSHQLQQEP